MMEPIPEPTAELPIIRPHVLLAEGLGLRTRRGWVFRDVYLALSAGSVTALAGPAGSGRSMLLLTLAGRARPTTGRLVVAGDQRRAAIRRSVAVARVTAAVELEPELHVVDHVREADLLARGEFDFRWAADVVGIDLDPVALVGDLAPDDATLLAVALVLAAGPRVIVVDDVDIAATPAQQARVWSALLAAGGTGVAVVASTIDGRLATDAGAAVVARGALSLREAERIAAERMIQPRDGAHADV